MERQCGHHSKSLQWLQILLSCFSLKSPDVEEEEKEGRFKRRRMMEQRPGCMRRPCSGGEATGTSRRFLRRRGAGEWLPDARPVSWSSMVGRFTKPDNQLGFFTPESPFGSGAMVCQRRRRVVQLSREMVLRSSRKCKWRPSIYRVVHQVVH